MKKESMLNAEAISVGQEADTGRKNCPWNLLMWKVIRDTGTGEGTVWSNSTILSMITIPIIQCQNVLELIPPVTGTDTSPEKAV